MVIIRLDDDDHLVDLSFRFCPLALLPILYLGGPSTWQCIQVRSCQRSDVFFLVRSSPPPFRCSSGAEGEVLSEPCNPWSAAFVPRGCLSQRSCKVCLMYSGALNAE